MASDYTTSKTLRTQFQLRGRGSNVLRGRADELLGLIAFSLSITAVFSRRVLLLLTLLCCVVHPLNGAEIDFAKDVRPILAQYCFKCHGPDPDTREAGLRLDLRETALRPADSGKTPIVPGRPEASELVRRIMSADPDELMPPPTTKKSLNQEQRRILSQWITAGAAYKQHWSFIAPVRTPIPHVAHTDWPVNPIDRFILGRLESNGLQPSPQADPYRLIRRVSLDLIGLPPTTDEVDAFLDECRIDGGKAGSFETAYERLVDRLLASGHYGERWARRWLDLARYADTNGYEKDRPRSIWPYRDWVIKALNADVPFDQFTIEQLAGDLLPEPTADQRIATGFHRNSMLNEEGGIDPLEFRFHAMTDRIATTGTTWLGLTLGCAQCHSHKYDPLSHREYYQLMAFLNNADEPDFDLPDANRELAYQANLAEAEKLLAALEQHWPVPTEPGETPEAVNEKRQQIVKKRFQEWLDQERKNAVAWTTLRPVTVKSNLPLLSVESDDSVFVTGDTTKYDTYELTYRPTHPGITALRLEALPDDRLPAHGPGMTYYEGTKGDFFLSEFILMADGQPVRFAHASESYAKNRFGNNPATAALSIDGDPQTGWSVDGRQGERHVAVYVLDRPIEVTDLKLKLTFGRHFASSLGKFRLSATAEPFDGREQCYSDSIETLLRAEDDQLTDAQRQQLWREFLLHAPELTKPATKIHELRQMPPATTTLVLQERSPENPRHTHRHHRGEFLQPREPVEAALPAFLPALPKGAAPNRLSFARWLVSRENPLTARVTVNRQWAAFFGQGLVGSLQDFGLQGDFPTHPELLDWLAVHFIEDGWSLKRLHKLIVMSATYRQSGYVTAESIVKDPGNRLLARGPRVRLEAELIRDSVLCASGLLSTRFGGSSVYPPQPASVVTEGTYGAVSWKISEGADRYRRSLYTFSKRTAPFAAYATFDAPSGEACIARRDVSNTPLQALTLLNDVMYLEAARALGKLIASEPGQLEEKSRLLFRRVLTREPDPEELRQLTAFYEIQRERLETGQLDPKSFTDGESDNATEQAAWMILARAILNLDEAITK